MALDETKRSFEEALGSALHCPGGLTERSESIGKIDHVHALGMAFRDPDDRFMGDLVRYLTGLVDDPPARVVDYILHRLEMPLDDAHRVIAAIALKFSRSSICRACHGTGKSVTVYDGAAEEDCSVCKGTGRIKKNQVSKLTKSALRERCPEIDTVTRSALAKKQDQIMSAISYLQSSALGDVKRVMR